MHQNVTQFDKKNWKCELTEWYATYAVHLPKEHFLCEYMCNTLWITKICMSMYIYIYIHIWSGQMVRFHQLRFRWLWSYFHFPYYPTFEKGFSPPKFPAWNNKGSTRFAASLRVTWWHPPMVTVHSLFQISENSLKKKNKQNDIIPHGNTITIYLGYEEFSDASQIFTDLKPWIKKTKRSVNLFDSNFHGFGSPASSLSGGPVVPDPVELSCWSWCGLGQMSGKESRPPRCRGQVVVSHGVCCSPQGPTYE